MQNFGRHLTCGILAAISTECCVQNFERNLPIIQHVEFRTKSPHNPACRIHAKLSPEFYIHNFGQNFVRNLRIMLRAEFWPKCQQIYGPNLHIILYVEFRQKSLICRTMHAEFRLKSPHNAACTIRPNFCCRSLHNSRSACAGFPLSCPLGGGGGDWGRQRPKPGGGSDERAGSD